MEHPENDGCHPAPPKGSGGNPERPHHVNVDLVRIVQRKALEGPVLSLHRDQPMGFDVKGKEHLLSWIFLLQCCRCCLKIVTLREQHPVRLLNLGVDRNPMGPIVNDPDLIPPNVFRNSAQRSHLQILAVFPPCFFNAHLLDPSLLHFLIHDLLHFVHVSNCRPVIGSDCGLLQISFQPLMPIAVCLGLLFPVIDGLDQRYFTSDPQGDSGSGNPTQEQGILVSQQLSPSLQPSKVYGRRPVLLLPSRVLLHPQHRIVQPLFDPLHLGGKRRRFYLS